MNWEKLLSTKRLRPSGRIDRGTERGDFESDFGRVVFSPAIRRMHDKTQVFPLTTDDNTHSRLTHSLEVMSVGYSLARKICQDRRFLDRLNISKAEALHKVPLIIKSVCLLHDIGNPPFGHFGETVFQNYFSKCFKTEADKWKDLNESQKRDFTNFDGNAQGLRVITKLQILNDTYGLNLTSAILAAYIKYPNYSEPNDKSYLEVKKLGVFQSELDYFREIVDECGLRIGERIARHPLAYIMEAADSICYLTMDIEDGFNTKLFSTDFLFDRLIPKIPDFEELRKETFAYGDEITKMVRIRIKLIDHLVNLAAESFLSNIDDIEAGTFKFELIKKDPDKLYKDLSNICVEKIFGFRDIRSLELTGHSVITGLLDNYIDFVFNTESKYVERAQSLISGSIVRAAFAENGMKEDSKLSDLDDYFKLRVIVDYISGMTDQYALNHFRKISGQEIS